MKFATVAVLAVATSAINLSEDEFPTEEQLAQMTAEEKEQWFSGLIRAARYLPQALRLIRRYGPKAFKYARRGSALYDELCKHISCP